MRTGGLPLAFEPPQDGAPQPGPTVPVGGWPGGVRAVPVGVSARHVHLSPEHVEVLFGRGHRLRLRNWISQVGQFAAEETVTLVGPKGILERVRVLGPARGATQVEISLTDARCLGLAPPVRLSGELAGSPGVLLKGPCGEVELEEGVIVAARHIHMHPEDANRLGIHSDVVRVKAGGERSVIFENVVVRIHPMFRLEMHIDTDEANAAGIKSGDWATILDPGS